MPDLNRVIENYHNGLTIWTRENVGVLVERIAELEAIHDAFTEQIEQRVSELVAGRMEEIQAENMQLRANLKLAHEHGDKQFKLVMQCGEELEKLEAKYEAENAHLRATLARLTAAANRYATNEYDEGWKDNLNELAAAIAEATAALGEDGE